MLPTLMFRPSYKLPKLILSFSFDSNNCLYIVTNPKTQIGDNNTTTSITIEKTDDAISPLEEAPNYS